MSFEKTRVCNAVIRVPPTHQDRPLPDYRGKEVFPNKKEFSNVFILAKKLCGKTTVIWNMLDIIGTPQHKVIIFSPNIEKDDTWDDIRALLHKKGISFSEFKEFKKGKKWNMIEEFVEENESDPQRENKKYIIIFDDQGKSMRDEYLDQLLKNNRHNRAHVWMSSQSYTDLRPDARKQLDFVLVFPKQPVPKLKELHKDLDLSVDLDCFLKMYRDATSQPYNFLYINRSQGEEFRENLNRRIEVPQQCEEEEDE